MRDYTDNPRPGTGYLNLLGSLVVLAGATAVWLGYLARDDGLAGLAFVLVVVGLPLLLVAVVVHAAFNTRYQITGTEFRLRSGFVTNVTFTADEIVAVEPKTVVRRVLGWGGGTGVANRLTNGLMLRLNDGRRIFLTPHDPEEFCALIDAARTPTN